MQAARHGHMDVVVMLVQAGAAVDRRNRLGECKLRSVAGNASLKFLERNHPECK